jgi:transcriptional regulator with PAS, ATPase and Fis domain
MRSTTSYEYPMVCIREVLANAVCHRNYEDHQRLNYVTLYNDRIEIKSPGAWASTTLTEGKIFGLSSLITESVQRNMRLAHAISSVGMMEVEGSGIPTAVRDCGDCQAPEPSVESRDGYVIVTIYPRENWDDDGEDAASDHGIGLRETPDLRQESANVYTAADAQKPEIERGFNMVIGNSDAMKRVLREAMRSAEMDANLLITGESGTGKELLATVIHSSSPRKKGPFVAINCGAIPPELVESELFGHVKGSFTGATRSRKGLFDEANGGTLLLDEVGELPLAAQAKLLRVLQEKAFRPIGSSTNVKVNVRIIATTNRDLEESVEAGTFRRDVYYRLNVMRLRIPPLRERKQDIRALVMHFVEEFAKQYGQRVESIPKKTIRLFQNYQWPGNVRELQNMVVRAISLTEESGLDLPDHLEAMLKGQTAERLRKAQAVNSTISDQPERIREALEKTGWRIAGPKGAASLLGMNPSTLRSRMHKLGIIRPKSAASH